MLDKLKQLKLPVGWIFLAAIVFICLDWYVLGPGVFSVVTYAIFICLALIVLWFVIWSGINFIGDFRTKKK